jgi:hypothetical protein
LGNVRFSLVSGHSVATQYRSLWADFVAEVVFEGGVRQPGSFLDRGEALVFAPARC